MQLRCIGSCELTDKVQMHNYLSALNLTIERSFSVLTSVSTERHLKMNLKTLEMVTCITAMIRLGLKKNEKN